jgi:hypothetical protein
MNAMIIERLLCTTVTIMGRRLHQHTIRIKRSAAAVMPYHHNCFSILGRQRHDESPEQGGPSAGDKDFDTEVKASIIEISVPSTREESDKGGPLQRSSIDEIQPEWLALERRLILRKPKIKGIIAYKIVLHK